MFMNFFSDVETIRPGYRLVLKIVLYTVMYNKTFKMRGFVRQKFINNVLLYSRQFERDLQKKAELKMKAASERRHEILVHKSYAARKEGNTELTYFLVVILNFLL